MSNEDQNDDYEVVCLLARKGQWVQAELGGGGGVNAKGPGMNEYEQFRLVRHEDGKVSLLAPSKNKWFRAVGGGGGDLLADADKVDTHEKFSMESYEGLLVSLKTDRGYFLRAVNGGGEGVDCRGAGGDVCDCRFWLLKPR